MDPRRGQLAALHSALLDAFRTRADLARMIGLGLGEQLDNIAGGDNDAAVVFNLLEWAESHGRTTELAGVALAANPGNSKLRAAAAGLGLPLPPLTTMQQLRRPTVWPWLVGTGGLLLLGLLTWVGLDYNAANSGLHIAAIRYYPAQSTLDIQVRNLDATDGVISDLRVTILERASFPVSPDNAVTPGPTMPPLRDTVTATPGTHIDFNLLPSAGYTATLTNLPVGRTVTATMSDPFAVHPHTADRFLLALATPDDLRVTLTALYNGNRSIACTFRLSQPNAKGCK